MRFVVVGLICVNLLKSSGVLRVGNLQAHLLVKLFLYEPTTKVPPSENRSLKPSVRKFEERLGY